MASKEQALSTQKGLQQFKSGTPANYTIAVLGHLEASWVEWLGMDIAHAVTPEYGWTTILTGELIDQAALFGILNGLYNFGFPLLSVQCTAVVDATSVH